MEAKRSCPAVSWQLSIEAGESLHSLMKDMLPVDAMYPDGQCHAV
jgi:hypothetical protein